mmetsp:Transcript_3380/g.7633  ORF Transcript_3380/g.7633 Transcript_3380/m.7633 type:complete len:242 (+) Transcript_3380:405-1130(+)
MEPPRSPQQYARICRPHWRRRLCPRDAPGELRCGRLVLPAGAGAKTYLQLEVSDTTACKSGGEEGSRACQVLHHLAHIRNDPVDAPRGEARHDVDFLAEHRKFPVNLVEARRGLGVPFLHQLFERCTPRHGVLLRRQAHSLHIRLQPLRDLGHIRLGGLELIRYPVPGLLEFAVRVLSEAVHGRGDGIDLGLQCSPVALSRLGCSLRSRLQVLPSLHDKALVFPPQARELLVDMLEVLLQG